MQTVRPEERLYITAMHVEGLRAAPDRHQLLPEPLTHLADTSGGLALLDAIELFLAGLDPHRAASVLTRLEVVDPFEDVDLTLHDSLPVQLAFEQGDAASLLRADVSRTLKIRLDLRLDPLLFGALREWALRDPRLVQALGEATASITVGWAFTTDLRVASIGVLQLRIGEVSFQTSGSDRPRWLPEWLQSIAQRFRRVSEEPLHVVAERLLDATLSDDPTTRARARHLASAVGEPPFSLGRLELVQLNGRVAPCFGPDLVRARQIGRWGAERLRIAEAVLLDQPDILLIERVEPADQHLLTWLHDATEGEGAVLEQVIVAQGGAA